MTISHFAASLASLVFASLASRVCASLASAVFASLASLVCASLCISAPDGSISLPLLHLERCFVFRMVKEMLCLGLRLPVTTSRKPLLKVLPNAAQFLGPVSGHHVGGQTPEA
jgi:hypothetical protein